MSMIPRVSVLITTHARPQQVCQAVNSALAQTLQDIEVIVILDGLDPVTLANLESIRDPRVRIHVRVTKGGQGAAINSGIGLASGTWTALLDDDDLWMPEKLEAQLRAAELSASASPIVGCYFLARSDSGDLLWPLRVPRRDEQICDYLFCRSRLQFGEGILPTSVLFASTELFRLVPMDENLSRHGDIDWLVRVNQRPEVRLEMPALRQALAIWQQQGKDRMSRQHDWRQSFQWISKHRHMVTPRAYAGFLLTWASFSARSQGEWGAISFLLAKAFRFGRPGLLELAVYAAVWFLPLDSRLRWSAWMTHYQHSGARK